jgi:uncharacterized membrane protein
MPDADRLLFILTLLAALGCGLIAGVFVMKAPTRLPTSHGIAAMQSINVVVTVGSLARSSERLYCVRSP